MTHLISRKYKSSSKLSKKEFDFAIDLISRDSSMNLFLDQKENKDKFLNDKDLALYAISRDPQLLSLFTAFSDDKDVVTKAISQDGTTLTFASKRLKSSFEVVKEAIIENPNAINFASESLRNSKKYAYALIKANPYIIPATTFPEEFYDDKEFARYAAQTDEPAFCELSSRLKDDQEIAILAIESSAGNFQNCSPRLKNNRKFAIWAISKDAWNIQFVENKGFLKDFDFARFAIEKDFLTFQLVSPTLWKDERLMFYSKDLSMPQWDVFLEILDDKNQYDVFASLKSFYSGLSVSEKSGLFERLSHELIENTDGINYKQQVLSKHQLMVVDWIVDGLDTETLNRPIENISLCTYIKEEIANRKIRELQKATPKDKKIRKSLLM